MFVRIYVNICLCVMFIYMLIYAYAVARIVEYLITIMLILEGII